MSEGPDGGRSWCIALALMVISMISAGIFRSQGYIFVAILNEFKVDRKSASMPFSVRIAVRNVIGPVIGILGAKYGVRTITILGAIAGSISSSLCFFAADVIWITVIFGVINGASTAAADILPFAMIGQYFKEYRTTASGIAYSGGCIASYFMPSVFTILLNTYGLNGTFLIMGGILLNCIPPAIMLIEPDWLRSNEVHTKKHFHPQVEGQKHASKLFTNSAKNLQNDATCAFPEAFHKIQDSNFRSTVGNTPRLQTKAANSLNQVTEYIPYVTFHYLINNISVNSITIVMDKELIPNFRNLSDIDLDYLKQHSDLVYEMFIMDLSNQKLPYEILQNNDPKGMWDPSREDIINEIESIFIEIKHILETYQNVNCVVKSNDKYVKSISLNAPSYVKLKCENLQNYNRHFTVLHERAYACSTMHSASNIYTDKVKKNYILFKLGILCKSNQLKIVSHLSQYKFRDVENVLSQVCSIYRLHKNLNNIEQCKYNKCFESMSDCKNSYLKKESYNFKESMNSPKSLTKSIKSAFMLFTNPVFLMICFARCTFFVIYDTILTTIVDFAMDKGFSAESGKFIIGALSTGDLLGRLCFGWVTDRGYVTLPRYMLIALICLGISSMTLPFTYSKWTLSLALFFTGIFQGSLLIRHPVLIAKYLSLRDQTIAIGCMEFPAAFFNMILPFYLGYFRDYIKSYSYIFYINGGVAILAGLVWILEPYLCDKNTVDSTKL